MCTLPAHTTVAHTFQANVEPMPLPPCIPWYNPGLMAACNGCVLASLFHTAARMVRLCYVCVFWRVCVPVCMCVYVYCAITPCAGDRPPCARTVHHIHPRHILQHTSAHCVTAGVSAGGGVIARRGRAERWCQWSAVVGRSTGVCACMYPMCLQLIHVRMSARMSARVPAVDSRTYECTYARVVAAVSHRVCSINRCPSRFGLACQYAQDGICHLCSTEQMSSGQVVRCKA